MACPRHRASRASSRREKRGIVDEQGEGAKNLRCFGSEPGEAGRIAQITSHGACFATVRRDICRRRLCVSERAPAAMHHDGIAGAGKTLGNPAPNSFRRTRHKRGAGRSNFISCADHSVNSGEPLRLILWPGDTRPFWHGTSNAGAAPNKSVMTRESCAGLWYISVPITHRQAHRWHVLRRLLSSLGPRRWRCGTCPRDPPGSAQALLPERDPELACS
jgi:hypothetical protein